jgi:hypothetical protein
MKMNSVESLYEDLIYVLTDSLSLYRKVPLVSRLFKTETYRDARDALSRNYSSTIAFHNVVKHKAPPELRDNLADLIFEAGWRLGLHSKRSKHKDYCR